MKKMVYFKDADTLYVIAIDGNVPTVIAVNDDGTEKVAYGVEKVCMADEEGNTLFDTINK